MNKTLAVSIVALVLSLSAVLFPRATETVVNQVNPLGSGSGQDHGFFETFGAGMSDGGEIIATSSANDATIKRSLLSLNPKY